MEPFSFKVMERVSTSFHGDDRVCCEAGGCPIDQALDLGHVGSGTKDE